LYILPFILVVLVVYSKFSYSFILKPFLWIFGHIGYALLVFGKFLARAFHLFVLIPFAEVISLKGRTPHRLYRLTVSMLFMIGSLSVIIGLCGAIIGVVRDIKVSQRIHMTVGGMPSSHSKPDTPVEEQYHIQVEASHPYWTETGIYVKKNDKVSVTATGIVYAMFPSRRPVGSSPAGVYSLSEHMIPRRIPRSAYEGGTFSPVNYLLDGQPINGLIGKIGTGDVFYIGPSDDWTVPYDGEILLGINQPWLAGAWENNTGAFTVSIIIRRW
jgi:hypothetical protein